MKNTCKRLIEVDLPIRRISKHACGEKNLRSGHPWHLHIWWARRPWGACRSVALASLLPAPSDPACPKTFCDVAALTLKEFGFKSNPSRDELEQKLLWFVGEYAKWELGADATWREAAKRLVHAAYPHGAPHSLDPFSGYGAIPGEAARLGCDSVASDLNPVALLCLRTILEAVPRHGDKLLDLFREGAIHVKKEAETRLRDYYPMHDGKQVIAWLWARTVTCEGPGCGAEIPLISQTTIAKGKRKVWIEITGDRASKKVAISIHTGTVVPAGLKKTAGGGHAECPICGFTTHKNRVKAQGIAGQIGNRLYGVALAVGARQGKSYANATDKEVTAYERAAHAWRCIVKNDPNADPDEKYPYHDPRAFTAGNYGIRSWGDMFSLRQKLALHTMGDILREYEEELRLNCTNPTLARDVTTALALAVSNTVHYLTTMSTWLSEGMISCFISGNAIAMRWDWAEANPIADGYAGGWDFSFKKSIEAIQATAHISTPASVLRANAAKHPLPDDAAELFFTDPPYYDVVPYADLSDLCYVWLKRFVGHLHPDLLNDTLTPKAEQIVVNPYAITDGRGDQSPARYQELLTAAFSEGRRILKPDGIGCIVFAHKGTAAWEALLGSIIDAGFIVTASWPIDTERAARMRAKDSAVLGSSVHIVVRPRENPDGSVRTDDVGDWRDVLAELPGKIRSWMQRLVQEDVVGADAIFSCLGPALEIYSRYSRVEKANGEQVFLHEFLEHVWATISREALATIFQGADSTGFEEDARLTAMWLWTLRTDTTPGSDADEAEDDGGKGDKTKGFALEFDAVNNIAKGLGIHVESMPTVVEISKGQARLLAVSERLGHLLGAKKESVATTNRRKRDAAQPTLDGFELSVLGDPNALDLGDVSFEAGVTSLDRVHQAMLLFAAGRGEAMKRFLVADSAGRDPRFWRLADVLSKLYPSTSEEKRWVDGVLARKKGLGL